MPSVWQLAESVAMWYTILLHFCRGDLFKKYRYALWIIREGVVCQ